jgi:hypothetical protein
MANNWLIYLNVNLRTIMTKYKLKYTGKRDCHDCVFLENRPFRNCTAKKHGYKICVHAGGIDAYNYIFVKSITELNPNIKIL